MCQDFLPNKVEIIYRPGFNIYKNKFGSRLLDCNSILDIYDYYKTDTHINIKGSYKVFKMVIQKLEEIFNVTINNFNNLQINSTQVQCLSELNEGVGDLTWDMNKGDLIIDNISDIYYSISNPSYTKFYLNIYLQDKDSYQILDIDLNDISSKYYNEKISWDIINIVYLYKKNILYKINKRVIIFYDSFLLAVINLYKDIFKEVFLVKEIFRNDIINKINPDFIIEFRVERFLL